MSCGARNLARTRGSLRRRIELPARSRQVLHVGPRSRVSLVLEDCTYLTWTVRSCGDATVVRLTVEEPGSTEDELEDVWLPVVEGLGKLLRAEAG